MRGIILFRKSVKNVYFGKGLRLLYNLRQKNWKMVKNIEIILARDPRRIKGVRIQLGITIRLLRLLNQTTRKEDDHHGIMVAVGLLLVLKNVPVLNWYSA